MQNTLNNKTLTEASTEVKHRKTHEAATSGAAIVAMGMAICTLIEAEFNTPEVFPQPLFRLTLDNTD